MTQSKLTDLDFWKEFCHDEVYRDLDDHVVSYFLQSKIPKTSNKTAIEIGCYAGNFMPTVSRLGYKVSGIDYNDNLPQLHNWLLENNINVGTLYK